MNTQFCRVGKIKPNRRKSIKVTEFEKRIASFVDDISKIDFSEGLQSTTI